MRLPGAVLLTSILVALVAAPTASADRVFTVHGASAPGPAKYDRIRVIEQGPRHAHNVLVLVPGTAGGAAYFHPIARDIVRRLPGWRVWSVDRRENLLEDHSVLDQTLAGRKSPEDLFRYYLEWLTDPSITTHFQPVPDASVPFARRWGMSVAIRDLHNVIKAAHRGGNHVVLGGHSLGGTITMAYATWDFHGRAGARDLSGLVLIDGGSFGPAISRKDAEQGLADLESGSPFLDVLGTGLPWTTGAFNLVGSTAARVAPDAPSVFTGWPAVPAALVPPAPTTNAGGYGYAVDDDTSPAGLALVHMHIGHLGPSGWADGELGTVHRAATVFSGIRGIDGSAWYHPRRLSLDGRAVAGGVRNRAQKLLGVRATHGRDVHVPIYAIETSLGAGRVLKGAKALARRSHVKRVKLVDRHRTYDHIDPLAAVPAKNAFLKTVIPFLRRVR
jgi:hypothetical protein